MAKISEQAQRAANLPTAPERQTGAVVPIDEGRMTGPPPDMDDAEMAATAGKGTSTSASDNLVPMVYILHYTDNRVDERDHANYIPGARPGDIVLRGAPEGMSLVRSDEGILFQPCYFWNDVTEWFKENDGAKKTFVGKHKYEFAKDVPGAKQGSKGKWHWLTADGKNELEETRNFAGIVQFPGGLHMPFLIALKGTGHSVGKAWMTKINSKMSDKGVVYASFAAFYRLRTEPRSKGPQRWFMYTVADARWATPEERTMGLKLHQQFASGEKQGETPETDFSPDDVAGSSSSADTSKVDASI